MSSRSLPALLLCCVLPVAYAADPPGSLFRIDISATRTTLTQPFQSTLYVEPRTEAVVSMLHQTLPLGHQLRVSVGAPFVTPTGRSAADVRIQILDQTGRDWSLRASPQLGVELGKEATAEGPIQSDVAGERYSLSVRATLVARAEFETATGRTPGDSVPCPAGMLAPAGVASTDLDSTKRGETGRCCRMDCSSGAAGWILTCCGAVYCCDCGVCCFPP